MKKFARYCSSFIEPTLRKSQREAERAHVSSPTAE